MQGLLPTPPLAAESVSRGKMFHAFVGSHALSITYSYLAHDLCGPLPQVGPGKILIQGPSYFL
jgi:hypothetical protein